MAQQTNCPACGAPLEYSGQQDEVRCSFCGAALRVTDMDGQVQFQVLDQPEPQKDILAKPVEAPEPSAREAQTYPGYEDSGSGTVTQNAPFAPIDFSETAAQPPAAAGGAAVYSTAVEKQSRSNTARWIWIGVAVLLVLAALCACLVFGALSIYRGS